MGQISHWCPVSLFWKLPHGVGVGRCLKEFWVIWWLPISHFFRQQTVTSVWCLVMVWVGCGTKERLTDTKNGASRDDTRWYRSRVSVVTMGLF